jgi:hypothetical protein
LPAQAAALTARRQSEKGASCLIRQIKAELALKKSEEGGGDLAPGADIGYGPAAELELRLDAAANALGDLQATSGCPNRSRHRGRRRRLAPARPCRCVSR